MGKEWHIGGRSSRRATAGDHGSGRPSLPGCMSALFHFFNFHSSHFTPHFVFNKHHSPSFHLSHHPPLPKASHHGVEASRNRLEVDEASISWLRNKEENLNIQMGLQIKTSRKGSKKSKASEHQLPNIDHIASESPSAKTPNLLARLMGLDILPQTSSPSSSSFRCRGPNSDGCYVVSGTRSLPESPRVSLARLSDVDRHHPRLSLQISLDKENIEIGEEIEREKERMRRKVALVEITNDNRKLKFGVQEVGFSQSKSEKSSKRFKKTIASSSKLRNQEVLFSKKQKLISMPMSMPRSKAQPREEEAFGCPTNNNLLNSNLNHPTKFSVKKDPSPPAAKIPHEQPCSYPKGKQKAWAGEGGERNAVAWTTATATATAAGDGGAAEFKYIKRILTTISSRAKWFSPSNSNRLDPSIFHHLETTVAAADAAVEEPKWRRCNRRLIFDLVEEVLGEMNKEKIGCWHVGELAEEVREKIEEFPRANCQVLEDIDALIQKDLEKWDWNRNWKRVAETQEIVKVVELHILDSLLRETTAPIASIRPYGKRCRFLQPRIDKTSLASSP